MKVKYSRDADILTVWVSEDPFDCAEEVNGVITHYSASGKPGLLEFQNAREFLLSSITNMVNEGEVGLP